jgi:hypothetical protein
MPAAQPNGKLSKRGRQGEGRPTKQTPEVVEKIAKAIALGLADDEAAAIAGVSDLTLTKWRRDSEFVRKIKVAVSERLAKRLFRIESGADGWQGTAWLLERLYPTRFSKPEVQISLSNSYQTVNTLSITISPQEARQLEVQASPIRAKISDMFAAYRPGAVANGNGHRSRDIQAEPVEKEALPSIVRKAGDENSSAFWNLFASGASERLVDKATAIFVTALIVSETLGAGRGHQAITAFKSEQPTVGDVLCVIDRLCGGSAGQQLLQRKAGFTASS